jgi:hypothetical protein
MPTADTANSRAKANRPDGLHNLSPVRATVAKNLNNR